MKAPTENGYYWVRLEWLNDWVVVELLGDRVFLARYNTTYHLKDVIEWGDKIEHEKI